jgi:hypothetical protein
MNESEAAAVVALVIAIPALALSALALSQDPVVDDVVRDPKVRAAWGEAVPPVTKAFKVTITAFYESLNRRRGGPGLSAAS